jgi:3-deoxy-7-phosphoheptulonate synthase
LRGGAFKPRSSPYSFQGLGKRGLELLALARQETGLPIVTEAVDEAGADLVAEYADCIQLGARNMQNYSLLKAVAACSYAKASILIPPTPMRPCMATG